MVKGQADGEAISLLPLVGQQIGPGSLSITSIAGPKNGTQRQLPVKEQALDVGVVVSGPA